MQGQSGVFLAHRSSSPAHQASHQNPADTDKNVGGGFSTSRIKSVTVFLRKASDSSCELRLPSQQLKASSAVCWSQQETLHWLHWCLYRLPATSACWSTESCSLLYQHNPQTQSVGAHQTDELRPSKAHSLHKALPSITVSSEEKMLQDRQAATFMP